MQNPEQKAIAQVAETCGVSELMCARWFARRRELARTASIDVSPALTQQAHEMLQRHFHARLAPTCCLPCRLC